MPVNTVSAAVHLTPVVVGTFLNHGKRKAQKLKKGEPENEATDDILFDQYVILSLESTEVNP